MYIHIVGMMYHPWPRPRPVPHSPHIPITDDMRLGAMGRRCEDAGKSGASHGISISCGHVRWRDDDTFSG